MCDADMDPEERERQIEEARILSLDEIRMAKLYRIPKVGDRVMFLRTLKKGTSPDSLYRKNEYGTVTGLNNEYGIWEIKKDLSDDPVGCSRQWFQLTEDSEVDYLVYPKFYQKRHCVCENTRADRLGHYHTVEYCIGCGRIKDIGINTDDNIKWLNIIPLSLNHLGYGKHNWKIVAAAHRSKVSGMVIVGVRHFDHHIRAMAFAIGGTPIGKCVDFEKHVGNDNTMVFPEDWKFSDQGFVDNFGTYIDREQGWIIASIAKQIIARGFGGDGTYLYSENIH
jgi:hypothetical protein